MNTQTKPFTLFTLRELYKCNDLKFDNSQLIDSDNTALRMLNFVEPKIVYAIENETGSITILHNSNLLVLFNFVNDKTQHSSELKRRRFLTQYMINICILYEKFHTKEEIEMFKRITQ